MSNKAIKQTGNKAIKQMSNKAIKQMSKRKRNRNRFIALLFGCSVDQKGFIALTSILIIGALILVISVGLSLRSIGETQMSLGEQESHRALALANLCAEQALMKLESVLNYAGNETISVDGQICDIMNIEGSGNLNRTVKTRSTVSGYTRKMKVIVSQISPVMQIASWEEAGDF